MSAGSSELGADVARDRLARRQPDRLAALQVARGERVVGLVVHVAGDLRRQVDQARGQAAVHPLRPLRRRLAGQVEEQRPVDGALGRHGAEAHQVGEHREPAHRRVDRGSGGGSGCGRSGRRRRRTRTGCTARRRARSSAGPRSRARSSSSAPIRPRQVVVEQDPLVVPHRRPPRLVEDVRLGDAVLAQAVDDEVVRAQERDVELVDEQVHVVARVADQREPLLVARHVVAARAEQQLGRVVALVEVRAADGAAAVDALEVQARRAEVPQPVLLGVRAQRRAVGGDVVRDELADERPAGRDGRVVAARLLGLARRRRRRRPRRSCAAAPRRPRTAAGR